MANNKVKRLLRWVRTDYLNEWLHRHGQTVDYLLLDIWRVSWNKEAHNGSKIELHSLHTVASVGFIKPQRPH